MRQKTRITDRSLYISAQSGGAMSVMQASDPIAKFVTRAVVGRTPYPLIPASGAGRLPRPTLLQRPASEVSN